VLRPTIQWRHLVSKLLSIVMHNSATCLVREEQSGYAAKSASLSCALHSGIAVRCDSKRDTMQWHRAQYVTNRRCKSEKNVGPT
jgi:hypothetical protein